MTRRGTRVGSVVLFTALAILRAVPSDAHVVGVSRGEYRADGASVRADLVFARTELLTALPDLDGDGDGVLSSVEIERGRGELSTWIQGGVAVRVPAGSCAGRLDEALLTEQDGVRLAAVFACPQEAAAFAVRLDLFTDLSLGHRHLVTATTPSQIERPVLFAAEPEVDIAQPTTGRGELGGVAPSLFQLGVEHILTGYDHLLFLVALVLVGGSLRSIIGVVTAFTLAHSVTLAVAAFDVWTPRPTLVEPAIALSIAYVGIENCVRPDLRRRWRLTFLFGLIHGFGFAGALREVAVSAAQLPLALASFNVGVEAGQLAVLAALLPLMWWFRRSPVFARGRFQIVNIAIAAIGLSWFAVRVASG